MATTKKTGGAKTTRSETVTVRLDPELRYLAEIASRIQRRTLSSYIEWAITESMRLNRLSDAPGDDRSVADRASALWDVDEADRFAKLGLHAPHLLNYDEQRLWKLIRENGYLWRGKYVNNLWTWNISESSLQFPRLREHWQTFLQVALEEQPSSMLPTWAENDPDPVPF